jgi:hypothetical protein
MLAVMEAISAKQTLRIKEFIYIRIRVQGLRVHGFRF